MADRPRLTAVWLGLGALVLLAVVAIYVGRGLNARDRSTDIAPVRAEDEAPPRETIFARGVVEGLDISPVLVTDADAVKGQHHVRLTRERGRITSVEQVAPSGAVRSTDAIAHFDGGGWQMLTSDSRGTVIETVTFTKEGVETRVDRAGSPFVSGCTRLAWKVDAIGNPIERTCQDRAGRTIVDLDGCEVVRSSYDDQRRLVATACFSSSGEARRDAGNVHRYEHQFDERGDVTQTSFRDEGGEPTTNADGCSRLAFAYDAAGNLSEQSCRDQAGSPRNVRGAAKVADRFAYDANGCLTKSEPLDPSGAVVIGERTYVTVYGKDAHCGETSRARVDAAGDLVDLPFDPSRFEYVLDSYGDIIEQRCFGAGGEPTECMTGRERDRREGSMLRFSYDDRGREISRRAFDAAGKPADIVFDNYPHEERTRYDDIGQIIEESYFDAEGAPTLASGAVARYIHRYDEAGAVLSVAGFGVDGAPAVDGTKIHGVVTVYNERHQRSIIEIHDAAHRPPAEPDLMLQDVSWPVGAGRVLLEREGGYVVTNRFVDAKGKTVSALDCRDRDTTCFR